MSGPSKYTPVKHKWYFIPTINSKGETEIIKISHNNFNKLYTDIYTKYNLNESEFIGVLKDFKIYNAKIYKIIPKYQKEVLSIIKFCRVTHLPYCRGFVVFTDLPSGYCKGDIISPNKDALLTIYNNGTSIFTSNYSKLQVYDLNDLLFEFEIHQYLLDNIKTGRIFNYPLALQEMNNEGR